MRSPVKISKMHWMFGIGASVLLYFLLPLRGAEPTTAGWIGIFAYTLFSFVVMMPLSEALFPDADRNAWQNQRGFMLMYLLVSSVVYLFVKEI